MTNRNKRPSRFGALCRGFFWALAITALLVAAVYTIRGILSRPAQEPPAPPIAEEPPTEPDLPVSELEAALFTTEDGFRRYPGARVGIDVSAHQGEIDWTAVAEDGIAFAMLRIGYRGYTAGDLTLDEQFESNLNGTTVAGIETGVYFFSQAVSEEEAVEEARFVLDALAGRGLSCPVIFDWEEIQDERARTRDMDPETLTACALAFCRAIEEAGYDAGIYFNLDYAYRQYDLTALQSYDFWLAEYAEMPTFRYAIDMWQYTDQGEVAGIGERVDLNLRFDG